MKEQVFQKEEVLLRNARESLEKGELVGQESDVAFTALVKGYDKLLRQSRKLVTMGDRMQHSLNALNRDLVISEEKYRGIFENVAEGIYRCDATGNLVEVNPAMAAMFGFADGDALLDTVGNISELFCHEEDHARYERHLKTGDIHRMEVRACGPGGVVLWAEISACTMNDDGVQQAPAGVVGILADVTERKHMIEEMCRLARTDSLTGLWNRGYFMELAAREATRSRRGSGALSLMIIDADYFKSINDNFGHDIGDKALVMMSRVLLDSVREVDVVGRFGGEEFVVLLPDAENYDACNVAERILVNIRNAVVEAGEQALTVTVSIGLASLESDEDSLDGLLKFADIALYAAKKNGRNRVEAYRRSNCPRKECADRAPAADEARQ